MMHKKMVNIWWYEVNTFLDSIYISDKSHCKNTVLRNMSWHCTTYPGHFTALFHCFRCLSLVLKVIVIILHANLMTSESTDKIECALRVVRKRERHFTNIYYRYNEMKTAFEWFECLSFYQYELWLGCSFNVRRQWDDCLWKGWMCRNFLLLY